MPQALPTVEDIELAVSCPNDLEKIILNSNNLIVPGKLEEWQRYVLANQDFYNAETVKVAYRVMKALSSKRGINSTTASDVINASGVIALRTPQIFSVAYIVEHFYKRGNEFKAYLSRGL